MTNFLLCLIAFLVLDVGILAFIVANKNKKIERQEEEKKNLNEQIENAELQQTVSDNFKKELEQNEELKNISHNDNIDGFNANIQRMQNLSKR